MNSKTLLTITLAALLAAGCQTTDCRNTDDATGSGGAGTGDQSFGTDPVQVGFGAYAPPCGEMGAFIERADDGGLGDLASLPVRLPFSGTVVRVAVIHAVGDAKGLCGAGERAVLVSEPTGQAVPSSPGLHDRLTFGADEVAGAPAYDLPGVTDGFAVALGRDLAEPMHGDEGDYVHLGTVLDSSDICQVGCGAMLDGSKPPTGSAKCVNGQAWASCAVAPWPTPESFYLSYVGWLDVVPD